MPPSAQLVNTTEDVPLIAISLPLVVIPRPVAPSTIRVVSVKVNAVPLIPLSRPFSTVPFSVIVQPDSTAVPFVIKSPTSVAVTVQLFMVSEPPPLVKNNPPLPPTVLFFMSIVQLSITRSPVFRSKIAYKANFSE